MIEVEQEEVVAVDLDPGQHQAHDRHDREHDVAFIPIGYPVF